MGNSSDTKRGVLLRIPHIKTSLPRIASSIICTLASCCSTVVATSSSSSGNLLAQPPAAFIGSRPQYHHHRSIHHPHQSSSSSSSSLTTSHYDFRPKQGYSNNSRLSHFTQFMSTLSESEPQTAVISNTANIDAAAASGDYFNEQQFAAFETAIEEIVSKRNVMRDFRKNEEDLIVVKNHLLDKRRYLPQWDIRQFFPSKDDSATVASSNSDGKEEERTLASSAFALPYTKQRLRQRSQQYLDHTGLTPPQHKLATILLAHLADNCAKNSSPQPLHVAWEKVLEAGMTPLSRTLSTYLYVLSLEGGVVDSSERDVSAEVAMFHDALYAPTEKTTTLLVKSLVGRGDAAGAEALLDELAADGNPLGQLRHRTTSPILKLYCEKGDIDSALRLYHRMRSTSRVKMDAATYADFIAAAAKNGYFSEDANCIVGAEDLGYSQACGGELLDLLITEMTEDVLDISEDSARVLQNGFAFGFKESGIGAIAESVSMTNMTTLCDKGSLVANRVMVDKETAKCPATDTTLRLIVLEKAQRIHVHDTLIDMAREKSIEYTAKLASKGRSTKDNAEKAERATQILREFSEWLDEREGEPYTAIVDGANVAYFGWGRINVHQLTHMVNALEKQGENVLVVFPQKYTHKKFHLRAGMMQVLKDEEVEFMDGLKEKNKMYVVPPMCLDDLYWMLACVSNQTQSSNGENIGVAKNNTEGRFPGLRPMAISNDKMRDHKMDLLDERSFRRWCCSHIVNYNFTEYVEDQADEREISFYAADVFSDEIQRNDCPGGGVAWHFPVSEWDGNERFCLRLPS